MRPKMAHYTMPDEVLDLVNAMAKKHKVSKSQIVTWAVLDYDECHDRLAARVKAETEARQRIVMRFSRPEPPKPRQAPSGSSPKVDWGKVKKTGLNAPWTHDKTFAPVVSDGMMASVFIPYDDNDSRMTSALVTGRIRAGINAWKKSRNMNNVVFHTARCRDPQTGTHAFEVWREV